VTPGAVGVLAWLAVGIPFLIGVYIALSKAAALFHLAPKAPWEAASRCTSQILAVRSGQTAELSAPAGHTNVACAGAPPLIVTDSRLVFPSRLASIV
jgi:hypothetical protein